MSVDKSNTIAVGMELSGAIVLGLIKGQNHESSNDFLVERNLFYLLLSTGAPSWKTGGSQSNQIRRKRRKLAGKTRRFNSWYMGWQVRERYD